MVDSVEKMGFNGKKGLLTGKSDLWKRFGCL
jgi:hypothetical protein